jgi:hypothetical protein
MGQRVEAPSDGENGDAKEDEAPKDTGTVAPDAKASSTKQDSNSVAEETEEKPVDTGDENKNSGTGIDARTVDPNASLNKKTVTPNPSALSHLSFIPKTEASNSSSLNNPGVRRANPTGNTDESLGFFPNSLVIVGAAALLESVVSSQRDTSSPELLNQVLDLLSARCEVLIHMLRSTSFLIMENAAILMFVLLKNRPKVASLLRELALSECLVLKHFYSGLFSPSISQRFISRFLVATWMSGPAKHNDGKALLLRIIPSGLVEYLKYAAISEEHRRNLDEMEEDFYANFGSALRTTVCYKTLIRLVS